MASASYQENRSRDITKPNSVLQIEILSQRITQSFGVFEKQSLERYKRHPRWRLAGSLRPYESKSCGKKVCLKKQSLEKKNLQDDSLLGAWGPMNQIKTLFEQPKSGEEKNLQDVSLLGASGLLLLVQPNTGGPPWRLHNDLPSFCQVRKGRQKMGYHCWSWTLISRVVPHDLRNRARVMILG